MGRKYHKSPECQIFRYMLMGKMPTPLEGSGRCEEGRMPTLLEERPGKPLRSHAGDDLALREFFAKGGDGGWRDGGLPEVKVL